MNENGFNFSQYLELAVSMFGYVLFSKPVRNFLGPKCNLLDWTGSEADSVPKRRCRPGTPMPCWFCAAA